LIGELVKSIESAFVELSFRRVLYLIFILGLGVGCVLAFDRSTGYSQARRLDARISALERLFALDQAGVQSSSRLKGSFEAIASDLERLNSAASPTSLGRPTPLPYEALTKFLAATLLPVLFIAYGLLQLLRGDKSGAGVFGGAFIGTLILGIPAVLAPTIHSLRATALGLFILQVIAVLGMTAYYGSKREAAG
jgi:hypothetical protein